MEHFGNATLKALLICMTIAEMPSNVFIFLISMVVYFRFWSACPESYKKSAIACIAPSLKSIASGFRAVKDFASEVAITRILLANWSRCPMIRGLNCMISLIDSLAALS